MTSTCARVFSLLLMALTACDAPSSGASEEILRQFQASGRTFVNLAEAVPGPWEKVCILGPYSDNKAVRTMLGFYWNSESQSTILSNTSISLLLFVRDDQVIMAIEHPRSDGDFTNLSRRCFRRESSEFIHQSNPRKGWPGLFPKA